MRPPSILMFTLVPGLLSVLTGILGAAEGFTDYTLANNLPNLKKAVENKLEKKSLKFGMIKLTDCIPIVAAKELGYFAEEGLNVTVEVQPNWKAVNDRVISGELDGSHMLYGHPLGAAIGFGVSAEIVVPYNISINGMGITVSNALWKDLQAKDASLTAAGYAMPVKADGIKAIAAERKAGGKAPVTMFMTFPAGSHNMNIRYWLAAGGVNPGFYDGLSDAKGIKDAEVILQVNPPPQMAQGLAQGNCDGFCVGEPWNMQVTVKEQTGRMIAPSQYLFDGSPDKVFGMTKKFVTENPNTTKAVTRALIRAGRWLDEKPENRKKAAEILANKAYIGAAVEILAESMTGTLVYGMDGGKADRRPEPDFNVFYRRYASFPLHSHAIWGLTQFRRWGMIPENKPDSWYQETAAKVFRADLYRAAFASLQAEGLVKAEELPKDDALSYPASAFIDHHAFDPAKPNEYLQGFPIGLK